jgi:hypothetical protein
MGRDVNFESYNGEQRNVSDVVLDPLGDGWIIGSWDDTCKFHKRVDSEFSNFTILTGGVEDAVDIGTGCVGNVFSNFTVSGGRYVLTLKSGSCDNRLVNWYVTKHGDKVDVELGNWSTTNPVRDRNNVFVNWESEDGEPITYAYRLGSKPIWINTNTKHLWWRSIGITVYWCFKYVKHRILKIKDIY